MVLIYSPVSNSRLQYTCSFIFKEQLQVGFDITTDAGKFAAYEGVKINYSNEAISTSEFRIGSVQLLFENSIQQQQINCFETNQYKAFFKREGADLSFDILAATFYLVSRYEEYLPHEKDMYGRYAHENSLAFKEGFLNLPLVNIWIKAFADKLEEKFSPLPAGREVFKLKLSTFNFIPTYDIDIAYAYRHKGLVRSLGAFLKSPAIERVKVLAGLQKDPFDSYEWMDALHKKYQLKPHYFFLAAQKNGVYDKNILPGTTAFSYLVKQHADKYETGIHPSWQSGDDFRLLQQEKKIIEHITGKEVKRSRQHYIRFNLPAGYRRLLEAGITDDYSLCYGSINGFRASVAASFYWFDLEKDEQTLLRIHPSCFMDANSFYEQHFSAEQAYEEAMHYLKICKEVNGQLITIWHNNFLGTAKQFAGWRACYETFIQHINL